MVQDEALAIDIEWDDPDEVSRTTLVPEFDVKKFAVDATERTIELKGPALDRLIAASMVPDPLGASGDQVAENAYDEEQALLGLEAKYEEVLGLAYRLVTPLAAANDDARPSLTPACARMFSVVDGQSSIAAVIARSGLPRTQALAALCELYQRGCVAFVEP